MSNDVLFTLLTRIDFLLNTCWFLLIPVTKRLFSLYVFWSQLTCLLNCCDSWWFPFNICDFYWLPLDFILIPVNFRLIIGDFLLSLQMTFFKHRIKSIQIVVHFCSTKGVARYTIMCSFCGFRNAPPGMFALVNVLQIAPFAEVNPLNSWLLVNPFWHLSIYIVQVSDHHPHLCF